MKYRAQQEGFIVITVRLQPFSSLDIADVYFFFFHRAVFVASIKV